MDFYAEYCQYLQDNAQQSNANLLEQNQAFNGGAKSSVTVPFDDFGVNRTEEFSGSLYGHDFGNKKNKKSDSEPSDSPPGLFGPCKVCTDKATGIHYGVSTCEGCKVTSHVSNFVLLFFKEF
jgi:hypothetical protein